MFYQREKSRGQKLDDYGTGSTRNNAPSSSSVSRYSRPSGPCRTSRIRCRNSQSIDSSRILGNARPRIIAPKAHQRPTVVAPRLDHVDLVSAIRPIFVIPQLARFGMNDQTQRIPMTQCVNLRPVAGAAYERIVGRHRAIIAQAQNFSAQAVRILRNLTYIAACGHVQHAIASEHDAPIQSAVAFERIRYNEVFHVCQCTAFEFSPRQCWCASSAAHRFCVREIDEPVLREFRMQRNIHQSAIAIGSHLRHARDWLRIQGSVAENTQPSSPLCDQHSSIGKERDRPRMRQASRQNRDSNLVLLRRIQYERACAQRRNRNTDSRLLRLAQRNGCGYQKCGTSGVTYEY